ncbi:NTP pyrophosphatase, house-cleaning of non-canonical NTPs [Streptoalloteichus tenebrarius]|uniref:NTP pyrophosphatase, house-cleaning of non-canonical NTPs n=1 Tax=Streptoalloteichus tenebrarius (strain ATCC 17920 / DSM 40477 / JCM 4838 / CBS 697.72 / NBRC 16177 / NCIMB 11028 / NRRL B-12390 / A12253. 1 / ISP 5477) TaxID=1933 RepID=A0ABT1HPL9_STRSD|nr:nucleotide pyrophosphohydrolase [Streptoalloteichus tenebrarius]MCP2257420.1 NTP pyrophosphatase, house-cleaning of non-canonical NTPs [Streptoalloteichus tenebrarius]BFE98366.1 nucleotide pyrophosphohydrolase [Streptoalloteichus tenebrarius]
MSDLRSYADELFAFVAARDWDVLENPKDLAMALGGECGELLALLQWLGAEDAGRRVREDPEFRRKFGHELADVLNYLLRLARNADIDLLAVAREKLAINERRYPVARARGSGAKYTELVDADQRNGLGRLPHRDGT